ncbi:F-box/kelch-repeat protein At3g23880-like [Ziziphus jujuba]|uniref:F-box/kelch-repeat protein At3g23880-like n=1 Tax=Ziziphus jujuba TaxID=326968 RepID=A0ABM3IAX8_ZIZJJ|nr:F-box/kelch-repeat protein At3g23880-like [Ziziphus jujuba]
MKGSLCNLAEGVMEQILLRLPVESLVQFKCACKCWHTLIDCPEFMAKHLHTSNNMSSSSTSLLFTDKYKLSAFENAEFSRLTIYHDDDDDDDHPLINYGVDEVCKLPIGNNLYVGTQCNGIFLMCEKSFQAISLYNPTTRKLWLIPDACPMDCIVQAVGFGYDSRANEHKVVRITSSNNNNGNSSKVCSAHIYNLSSISNDSWTEIELPIEDKDSLSICEYGNQVYCKGVYYWMTDGKIIYFDISDEEFHVKPLPKENDLPLVRVQKLMLWNNDFVALLICSGGILEPLEIEMWVLMDGDDGRCCWTKHLSIGPLIFCYCPLSFWKSDELLLAYYPHYKPPLKMTSDNLGTRKLRDLPIPCSSIFDNDVEVIPFVKSLVSFHTTGTKSLSALPCKHLETSTSTKGWDTKTTVGLFTYISILTLGIRWLKHIKSQSGSPE